jgi:prevent-host-death family protein
MDADRVSVREARARFADLLDEAERGEVTLVTRHGHDVAAIVPVSLLDRLMSADATSAPAVRRSPYRARPGRAPLVAARLTDLRGPAGGIVELPLRLFWSAPDRTFDLDKPSMLRALYEIVLREAFRQDDLTMYVNGDTLKAVWPDLFLPKGVRSAWEERHPSLSAAGKPTR